MSEAQPLVSIVLPTHNGTRYLDQSVRSCVEQTLRDWELIIVDDCSSDATPEHVARWVASDGRIRSIRHDVNIKLPAALNSGHAAARGRYLTWTSDDNLYRPEALAEMVAFLEAHPDVGLVYSDYSTIDDDGKLLDEVRVPQPNVLAYHNPVGASFMYRRAVWEKLGGYATDMFLAEDYEFWVRASLSFKLATLRKDLYLYRYHAGSLTSQRKAQQEVAIARVVERHIGNMAWVGRADRAKGYLTLAGVADRQGRRKDVVRYFWAAAKLSPAQPLKKLAAWAGRAVRGIRRSRLPAQ